MNFHFRIQKRVGFLIAAVSGIAVCANLVVALMRLNERFAGDPSTNIANAGFVLLSGALAVLTTRWDRPLWRWVQVGMFFASGLGANVSNTPGDLVGGLMIAAGFILLVQYSLMPRRPALTLLIAIAAVAMSYAAVVIGHASATIVAIESVLFSGFLLVFVWISFTEEIKAHVAATDALQTERSRNEAFVYLGKHLATLVHNLGTTLVTLAATNAQLRRSAADDQVGNLVSEQSDLITRLSESVAQLIGLVKPQQSTPRRELGVNRLVRQLAEHYLAREVELQLDLDERLPPVSARPVQILQLIENLVENAVEAVAMRAASPDHGGSRYRPFVRITTRRAVEGAGIVITDNGIGIDGLEECRGDECARYFELGRTTKVGGTGLGMLYVLETAADEGWGLSVRSACPGGTTVRVTIPTRSRSSFVPPARASRAALRPPNAQSPPTSATSRAGGADDSRAAR